mgnify:CR=1 FL=1
METADNTITKSKQLIDDGEVEKAEEILNSILEDNPSCEEGYLLRGQIKQKKENLGGALNDYNMCLNLNAENRKAQTLKLIVADILNLSNNFHFEDPYTDNEHHDEL